MFSLVFLLLLTFTYNCYIIIKYKKIPKSLSETAYMFGGVKRYLFSLYCLIIGIILLPKLFIVTNGNFEFIPFIFITGLLLAGITPNYKEHFLSEIHNYSAYISFIGFIIFIFLYFKLLLIISYVLICLTLVLIKKKCWTYIVEIISLLFLNIWLLYNG